MNNYKNEIISKLKKALSDSSFRELLYLAKEHSLSKNCINHEILAKWIISEYNYGLNTDTCKFSFHFDRDYNYKSNITFDKIINDIAQDENLMHLLLKKKIPYKRPEHNPWIRKYLHLGLQAEVLLNEPEIAQKWQEEAKAKKE